MTSFSIHKNNNFFDYDWTNKSDSRCEAELMRKILNKCRGKFERLIYEMLNFKKEKETDSEHRENDSIPAKLFI